MPQTIGTPKIQFLVSSGDPKFLVVSDVSEYFYAQNSPAIIKVTTPGASTPVTHTLAKNALNVFNSHNLRLSCFHNNCDDQDYINLPDGIYCIEVLASPDTFRKKRYYLKTDNMRIEMAKIYVKVGIEYQPDNQEFMQWSAETELMLSVAESHAMLGNIGEAQRFFRQAETALKKYMDCKNCY